MAIGFELPQCVRDVNETLYERNSRKNISQEFGSGARAGDLLCIILINTQTRIDEFPVHIDAQSRQSKGSIIERKIVELHT